MQRDGKRTTRLTPELEALAIENKKPAECPKCGGSGEIIKVDGDKVDVIQCKCRPKIPAWRANSKWR